MSEIVFIVIIIKYVEDFFFNFFNFLYLQWVTWNFIIKLIKMQTSSARD